MLINRFVATDEHGRHVNDSLKVPEKTPIDKDADMLLPGLLGLLGKSMFRAYKGARERGGPQGKKSFMGSASKEAGKGTAPEESIHRQTGIPSQASKEMKSHIQQGKEMAAKPVSVVELPNGFKVSVSTSTNSPANSAPTSIAKPQMTLDRDAIRRVTDGIKQQQATRNAAETTRQMTQRIVEKTQANSGALSQPTHQNATQAYQRDVLNPDRVSTTNQAKERLAQEANQFIDREIIQQAQETTKDFISEPKAQANKKTVAQADGATHAHGNTLPPQTGVDTAVMDRPNTMETHVARESIRQAAPTNQAQQNPAISDSAGEPPAHTIGRGQNNLDTLTPDSVTNEKAITHRQQAPDPSVISSEPAPRGEAIQLTQNRGIRDQDPMPPAAGESVENSKSFKLHQKSLSSLDEALKEVEAENKSRGQSTQSAPRLDPAQSTEANERRMASQERVEKLAANKDQFYREIQTNGAERAHTQTVATETGMNLTQKDLTIGTPRAPDINHDLAPGKGDKESLLRQIETMQKPHEKKIESVSHSAEHTPGVSTPKPDKSILVEDPSLWKTPGTKDLIDMLHNKDGASTEKVLAQDQSLNSKTIGERGSHAAQSPELVSAKTMESHAQVSSSPSLAKVGAGLSIAATAASGLKVYEGLRDHDMGLAKEGAMEVGMGIVQTGGFIAAEKAASKFSPMAAKILGKGALLAGPAIETFEIYKQGGLDASAKNTSSSLQKNAERSPVLGKIQNAASGFLSPIQTINALGHQAGALLGDKNNEIQTARDTAQILEKNKTAHEKHDRQGGQQNLGDNALASPTKPGKEQALDKEAQTTSSNAKTTPDQTSVWSAIKTAVLSLANPGESTNTKILQAGGREPNLETESIPKLVASKTEYKTLATQEKGSQTQPDQRVTPVAKAEINRAGTAPSSLDSTQENSTRLSAAKQSPQLNRLEMRDGGRALQEARMKVQQQWRESNKFRTDLGLNHENAEASQNENLRPIYAPAGIVELANETLRKIRDHTPDYSDGSRSRD